jgi:FlaA1/EpsC-like NDP-sugar epimerase
MKAISKNSIKSVEKILIFGAGGAGKELLQSLKKFKNIYVFGFIDDDKSLIGKNINKIPVLSNLKGMNKIINKFKIDAVYIAIPSSSGDVIKHIVSECSKTNVRVKIVPRISEIISGDATYDQVRDIEVEDILGRAVVRQDLTKAKEQIQHKIILVTGAAGSIGTELCKQILYLQPDKLICLDNRESAMFYLEQKLLKLQQTILNERQKENTLNDILIETELKFIIADIKDEDKINRVFNENGPQIVFNAAAYKHVPLMESNIDEAIKTNIIGTMNLMNAAIKHKTKSFILISTDKAVNPTNVMGATKRLTERLMSYCTAYQKKFYNEHNYRNINPTNFSAVRFGNVLNSDGSVIPTFKEQIKEGLVTITHKNIYRYFMTLSEAAQLVIQTSLYSGEDSIIGNNIFILDMGEPVKILDLAKSMIRLSGKTLNRDVKIKYIGLRPGEKLYEETLTKTEKLNTTNNNKIFILKKKDNLNNKPDLFIQRVYTLVKYARYDDYEPEKLKTLLKQLVPTYKENKK